MPRCLRLHKVPPHTGFCAICGARVLPGWAWLCLGALPLMLLYSVIISRRPLSPQPVETVIVTATEPASSPTRLSPSATSAPTLTFTPTQSPTPTPTPSPSPTPTATLNPKVVLFSYHDLYVIAMGAADGWVLKQDTHLDNCGWFTLIPQANGKVAILTCFNRYITSPRVGNKPQDWILQQEAQLDECGKFTVSDEGDGKYAFKTCAERYFTATDNTWGDLSWLIVAQTKDLKDWERFFLQPPK